MSTTTDPSGTPSSAAGFEERLLDELRAVVAQRAQQLATGRPQLGGRARTRTRGRSGGRGRGRRPGHGRHLLAGAAVIVCASGTVGGLALAGTFSTTAIDPQAWVDGQRVQPEPAITPDQTADLGILRRPRVASDVLPASEAQTLTNSPAAANGANVDQSRRAEGFTSGAAWIVPGDGHICFLFDNPPAGGGGTCQPDASVADGDFPVETGFSDTAPGQTSVAGVVPDGVATVTLNIDGGATVTAPVHENVYMTTIQGGLASVTYDGPNGPVTLGN